MMKIEKEEIDKVFEEVDNLNVSASQKRIYRDRIVSRIVNNENDWADYTKPITVHVKPDPSLFIRPGFHSKF